MKRTVVHEKDGFSYTILTPDRHDKIKVIRVLKRRNMVAYLKVNYPIIGECFERVYAGLGMI
ncbi:MAG: hypothetical protein WC533_02410 [Candidatus Pacearchaeota archaeon]